MAKKLVLGRISEAEAERIARIIGPASAHAQALAECRRRRDEGEDVHLWRSGNSVIVGPTPPGAALPPAGGR